MKRYLPIVLVVIGVLAFSGSMSLASADHSSSVLLVQNTDPNAPIDPGTGEYGYTKTDLGDIPNHPAGFVQNIYGIGVGFLGMIAVVFFMVGGYFVMTSRGDPMQLAKGKSFIVYSVLGLLLAVFGWIIVEVITGTLKIPGFS